MLQLRFRPVPQRPRRLLVVGAVAAGVVLSGCRERLVPVASDGDVLRTDYGPAQVQLVSETDRGPIFRLVFESCHADMAADDFDPVQDASAPKPPSLQGHWIWTCHA